MNLSINLLISPLMFFSSEKELFTCTFLLKKTPQRIKILLYPVWNKILKIWDILFEIIQIEVQCSKNYFNFFLPEEPGALESNTKNQPQKPRSKLNKYVYYIFLEKICTVCSPVQVVVLCKHVLILQKQIEICLFK